MYRGVRYFKSRAGRGKFVKLLELEPDKQSIFKVGDKVEVGRDTKECGVISWVGNVDGSSEDYVKVVTVSYTHTLLMYVRILHSYVLYLWCSAEICLHTYVHYKYIHSYVCMYKCYTVIMTS